MVLAEPLIFLTLSVLKRLLVFFENLLITKVKRVNCFIKTIGNFEVNFFYLYSYLPHSQESNGGAKSKQLSPVSTTNVEKSILCLFYCFFFALASI